ncbi:thiamine pyrophosphate-binding protein [Vibrio harveyi]|uniref:thiamine pyrophosphate-binding protein n=1 Tax=Vibrio harveyi TaxID=669 RepID=UPI004064A6EC
MSIQYTDEPQAQIVIALLKEHGVRKIVVSPGATNIPIAGSVQSDPFFEVYSSVDERSAAYIACGLAEDSGEPVAISCTGATASRNYMPGLTEAYYRKLPIIAITSFNGNKFIGHLMPQNIDRTNLPNDIAKLSVNLPVVKDESDFDYCSVLVNKAITESTRNGGGPVHINLTTTYKGTFNTTKLPNVRVIKRVSSIIDIPKKHIEKKKVAIFIGSHKKFTKRETDAIEKFCVKFNAVVLCDHTSSYKGKYRIQSALVCSSFSRIDPEWKSIKPEIVIHIGEVSGDYPSMRVLEEADEVWRISEDGEIRDKGGKLGFVYQGTELSFFESIIENWETKNHGELYSNWLKKDNSLRARMPEVPYSNLWIASKLSKEIPNDSYLNLAILNSLRSWNFFNIPEGIDSYSNVGGFGIDGCISTLVGASLVKPERLYFGVIGDLAFFYDINVIANRHLGNNVRLLLINNGCGTEFKIGKHIGSQFGDRSDDFIAAGGHFGSGNASTSQVLSKKQRKENSLAKSWANSLGFTYLVSTSKEDFDSNMTQFLTSETEKPIILECFTDANDEEEALNFITSFNESGKAKAINKVKTILPNSVIQVAKKIVK